MTRNRGGRVAPVSPERFSHCGIRKMRRAVNFVIERNYKSGYMGTMSISSPTARSLAALGHDARLGIFRLLVKAGHNGLTVGQIADHLALPASTLAHHLRTLVDAGLVVQEKTGREVVNRVDFTEMHRVLDFLTSECCSGVELVDTETAA